MQSSAEQSPSFLLVHWSSPLSVWNKASHCAQMDNVENNPASGSDAVKPMATRATQALVLSSQLYLVLLLIAESWLEWGEERLEVQSEGGLLNRGMEGGRVDEAGSGRWSLIRDWTAANLPAASAQRRDYWGGKKREHTPPRFNLSSSSSLSLSYSLVFFTLHSGFYCSSQAVFLWFFL